MRFIPLYASNWLTTLWGTVLTNTGLSCLFSLDAAHPLLSWVSYLEYPLRFHTFSHTEIGTLPMQLVPYVQRLIASSPPIHGQILSKLLQRTLKNGTRCQPPAYIEIEVCEYLSYSPLHVWKLWAFGNFIYRIQITMNLLFFYPHWRQYSTYGVRHSSDQNSVYNIPNKKIMDP